MTLGTSKTPAIVTEFWNSLKATDHTVACPRCAQNLEVRRAGRGRNTEFYVLHHDTCIRVFPGNSQVAQVVRQLAQDEAHAQAEAQDAATIALQDAEADAALFTEEDIIRFTQAVPVTHNFAPRTNQEVINLFHRVFDGPYIEVITRAGLSGIFSERKAAYSGPDVEALTLTEAERKRIIAAL